MKRTELKRGGRLRHKSRTNSRPQENLELREQYRRANPLCEVWPLLIESGHHGEMLPFIRPSSKYPVEASEIHHLAHFGKVRADLWSNLVAVCRMVHNLDSGKYQVEFRLACLESKRRKGEFDIQELNKAFGAVSLTAQPLLAWLDRVSSPLEWFEGVRLRLIQEVSKNA